MIKKLFFMILGSLLILSACSNNDEKDNTIDRFFNGDEILIDTNGLNGKISVKLILEEKKWGRF